MAMKNLILTAVLLFSASPVVFGGADPAAQELLVAAEQQASLFGDDASPLQLEVDFVAQNVVPTPGHLTIKWGRKNRWWRQTTMGDFVQTEVRNGERLYTSRNAPFTPLRIPELLQLIPFSGYPQGLQAKKQKRRVENGIDTTCLQVEHEGDHGEPHEICLSPATHDMLSDEWKRPPDEQRTEKYAEYFDFRGHRYPRQLELLVNGSKMISAHVVELTAAAFDEGLLAAPKGAMERRMCAGMKHAVPVKTPDPVCPKSASRNGFMGDTTVSMTVLADGSVDDIQLIGKAAHSMDEATLQTLKSWRFKPAMCGTEPVMSDIEVVVSFRLE
jgi:TonB family protein